MIITVLGSIDDKQAGVMLPHEHILVGFVEDGKLSPDMYDRQEVIKTILPNLIKLKESGCDTLVDCAPEYLGRDPLILKALSEKSGVHLITNTGLYKAPYLPAFAYEASVEQLANRWIEEACKGIGGTGVFPGFIKIALNDGRINEIQQKILLASMRTSLATNLVIQAHTIGGETILHAAEIMRTHQFDMERFVWVHAQSEHDLFIHEQMAGFGMWISIDGIGQRPHEDNCKLLKGLVDRGLEDKIIISQDTGWYNVGQKKGGQVNPYHKLFTEFVPFAVEWGIDQKLINKWITTNAVASMRVR